MDAQEMRIRYLQSSARMLFLSSASTSQHLSAQCLELAHSRSTPAWKEAVNACEACGGFLVPGWTTSIKVVTSKAKRNPTAQQKDGGLRRKLLSRRCLFCNRVTKETVDQQWKRKDRQAQSPAVSHPPVAESPQDEPVAEKSSKLSSKKRARARKDREGLQALLNKSAQTKSAPSLNLMDLMKR
jgi:hypothetical protein